MAKQLNPDKPTKWEITYDTEECVSTWKYNMEITTNGPVSVEHRWKKGFDGSEKKKKTLGDLAKEARKSSKSKGSKS